MNLTPRIWFFSGFLSCLAMLVIGAYFQIVEELEPCPLCISQRIAILLTGLILLIACLHNPQSKGVKIYALISGLFASIGASISIRHVWLQDLPEEQVPECGPGFDYMLENFPLTDTLHMMLNGTGECAEVLWTFQGISIPGWTLVAFVLLAGLSFSQIWNTKDS